MPSITNYKPNISCPMFIADGRQHVQKSSTHLRSSQAEDRTLADATGSPTPGMFGGTRELMSAEAASPSFESMLLRSARWSAMEQPQTRPSSREVDARRLAPWSPVQATSPVRGRYMACVAGRDRTGAGLTRYVGRCRENQLVEGL